MIELSLQEIAVFVIGLSMAVVVIFELISRKAMAKHDRKFVKTRVICRLCLATFAASGREKEQSCPECGAKTGREGPTPLG